MSTPHKKKAAAAAMGKARWKKQPAVKDTGERNPAAVLMGQARWAEVSKKERSRLMKAARRAPGSGKPRAKQRCFCGANALTRAFARAFDCCKRAGMYPRLKSEK